MKKIILVLLLFIYLDVFALESVSLDKCVDGDTAWFISNEVSLKYRFLAVDTPETLHPTKDGGILGKTASEYTCSLLMNAEKIVIEYDNKSSKTDKYNRELVWVFIDDILLQELLIDKGYARVEYIYGDYKYVSLLREKELIAKEERIGIWGNIFTITFKYKDKSYEEEVIEGSTIDPIKLDNESEIDFIGWFNDNKPFDFNSKIDKNIELVAKYKESPIIIRILLVIMFLILVFFLDRKKFNKIIKKIQKRLFE